MHNSIKKALLKQKVRRSHSLIIREEATLYSTFVQPFTDVVSAIKLGTQEVLSAAKLAWDTITLSPKKMNAAREEFKERQSSIEEKWKPIMDRTMEGLKRGDADLLAMAFAPGAVLTYAAANSAISTGAGAVRFLGDSGWKIPLLSSVVGPSLSIKTADTPSSNTGNQPQTSGGDEKRSLLQKLGGLFYIENSWLAGELITENKINENASPGFQKEMENWLKDTGVSSQFEKTANDYTDLYSDLIDKITSDAIPKIQMMGEMNRSSTVEQFASAANAAKGSGIDNSVNGDQLTKIVDDAAKKLAASPDFDLSKIDSAESKNLPEQDNISEDSEAKLASARKTAFLQIKKDFDDKALEKINSLKQLALEEILKYEPKDQSASLIKKTKSGIKFLKMFEDAKLSINNA